jgi:general secretion pathway protein G
MSARSSAPTRSCQGMTLIEVLAVVVILGLIAATLALNFSGSFGKAKRELVKTGISQVVQKIEMYQMEHGQLPGNDLGLAVLSDGHATPEDPFYIDADKLLDPWNRPFWFVTPGPGSHPYEVISYGRDGSPGGTGEDADTSSADLRGDGE